MTLPDGRRQQALPDAEIAEDVAAQRSIGRAVLAQQLAAIADPAATGSMSESRGGPAQQQTAGGLPSFFGRGVVGYQPVISTLPEGTNLSVIAVISADRRYVRVTPTPLFSGVGQVTQFEFASGGGGGGMGGGGIGGMGGGMGGMGGGGMG